MSRFRWSILLAAAIMCVAIASSAHATWAAVKSASTDGEATVYLMGKFSENFDVAYRAVLKPGPHNKSSAWLSMLLVGDRIPGPGISVGLAGDASDPGVIYPFTDVVYPNLRSDYKSQKANCARGCVIELRGDAHSIYAYVGGKELGAWSRSDLYLLHPSIQLNAEAHGAGDVLDASLTPLQTIVAGHAIPHPTCAFTTRGIEPTGLATITFHGKTKEAAGAFVNLSSGAHGNKC